MRTIHWLYFVTVLLFVTSVGLVVASAKASQHSSSLVTPVASMKEIMNGMVTPASTAVFNAVGTTYTTQGIEEKAPKSDREWQDLTNNAAMLVEAGNLMLVDGRLKDKGDWVKLSQAFINAAKVALDAARAHKTDGVFASGEAIDGSCDRCHEKYQK
jgi:cytochrome c556